MRARPEWILHGLERATAGVNMVVVLAMMVLVVGGTTLRYAFSFPVHQVSELTEYMMVAITYLTVAYIQFHRHHIRMDFFISRQSSRTQAILGVVTTLGSLIIFAFLTWAGWQLALKALRYGFTSEEAGFPLFPARVLIPIGSFLMCLRLLADLRHKIWVIRRTGQRAPEATVEQRS